MGHRHASQIKIIGLLIRGTRRGGLHRAPATENGQKAILYLCGQLLMQANEVFGSVGNACLPQEALGGDIDGFESDDKIVAELAERPGEQASDAHFHPHFLGIEIERDIPAGHGGGTNFQGSRIGQDAGQFVG